LFVRDHELAEIANIADRRILKAEQNLEKVFDRIRPILYGRSPPTYLHRHLLFLPNS